MAQRGGVFLLVGAHIERKFEFLQSQWAAAGDFISHGTEHDPIIGNSQGDGKFTIPKRPVRICCFYSTRQLCFIGDISYVFDQPYQKI